MSDEDRAKFEELLNDLNVEYQPNGTTEGLLVNKMALAFLNGWRILLTERFDINDTQDDSKQVALMLRYYSTADRAFNRNLQDLRQLQKERQKEEIGFVPPIPMQPERYAAEPTVKSDAPPDFNVLDPDIEPLNVTPRWKSPGDSPQKAKGRLRRKKIECKPHRKPEVCPL